MAAMRLLKSFGVRAKLLPLARHLVELLGGRMGLSSTVGEGRVFFFTLPVAAA